MVKNFIKIISICFFLSSNVSIANEKNPILNSSNNNILKKYFYEINLIGKANYSYLFWNIYDAQLYSPTNTFNKNKFALLIRYNKEIKKEHLVKETIDDIRKQKKLSKNKIDKWTKIFINIYQTTKIGNRFLAIKIADDKSIFYFNEKKIYESSNKEFIELFFNIWLRNNSKNPTFTKKLLGKDLS